MKTSFLTLTIIFIHCSVNSHKGNDYYSLFKQNQDYYSDGFDYPVGKPNANAYYNAQVFGSNGHLGDDWNGKSGGNSDLGDPIYSIGNGFVSEVKDYGGGWGKVIRIIHAIEKADSLYLVESLYAHCDTIITTENEFIKRGTKIATIGNCDGIYNAHLHLEIRTEIEKKIGSGYADSSAYHIDPSKFISENRPD